MYISSFRVTNYSTYVDSGWINLSPTMNLFVGINNSGKSALLLVRDAVALSQGLLLVAETQGLALFHQFPMPYSNDGQE